MEFQFRFIPCLSITVGSAGDKRVNVSQAGPGMPDSQRMDNSVAWETGLWSPQFRDQYS